MNFPEEDAAGQIQTIRAMLERATVYRAISLPGAALGGMLALPAAWLASCGGGMRFLVVWFATLAIVGAFNAWQLARQARRDGRVFFSNGMRLALRALVPPLLAGGVIGGHLAQLGHTTYAAACWILCYGLALLASREFAPQSIARLGTAFFLAGLAGFPAVPGIPSLGPFSPANVLMLATFGLLHLAYAAALAFSPSRAP